MGLSVEIAERLADANIREESTTPVMDAYMAKKNAVARNASAVSVKAPPAVKAVKTAPVPDAGQVVTKSTNWIVGETFRDRWGSLFRVTTCEPGHVWAEEVACFKQPAKRFRRSVIVGCVKYGRTLGQVAGKGRPIQRSVGYKLHVGYDEHVPKYIEYTDNQRPSDVRVADDIYKVSGKWPNNVNRDYSGRTVTKKG